MNESAYTPTTWPSRVTQGNHERPLSTGLSGFAGHPSMPQRMAQGGAQ